MIELMLPKPPYQKRLRGLFLAVLVLGSALAITAVVTLSGGKASDNLSAAETAQRASTFTGSVSLPLVAASDREVAYDTMALPPEAKISLKADVEAGRTGLAWLAVWDDQAADGDRVRIAAGGFALDLDLYKAPHRIGVPISADGALTITGLHDGGGGITLAIQTTDGVTLTPVIEPGEILPIGLQ